MNKFTEENILEVGKDVLLLSVDFTLPNPEDYEEGKYVYLKNQIDREIKGTLDGEIALKLPAFSCEEIFIFNGKWCKFIGGGYFTDVCKETIHQKED